MMNYKLLENNNNNYKDFNKLIPYSYPHFEIRRKFIKVEVKILLFFRLHRE